MAEKIKVGGELEAVTKDGKLADAAQVVDSTQSKTQELINSEVKEKLDAVINTDGSVKIPTITLSGDVTGSGTTAISGTIASGAVTTDKIATDAVTTAKIASKAVTTGTIADDAVTADKIASNAVGYDQIAVNSITTSMIRDSQVTTAKIADSNVTTAKIANSAVTNAKLANSKVTIGNKSVSLGGTLTEIPEAYLSWGGRDLVEKNSITDAIFLPQFSGNRLACMTGDAIKIEYSTDNGDTWTEDTTTTTAQKTQFVTQKKLLYIGGIDNSDSNQLQTRITIDASTGHLYSQIQKIALYVAIHPDWQPHCKIEAATPTAPDNFYLVKDALIGGYSGYTIINDLGEYFLVGGSSTRYIRFTFYTLGSSTAAKARYLWSLYMYGGFGWTCPSNTALYGVPFTTSYDKTAAFEGGITTPSLTASTIKKSGGTSAQFLKADGSVDGNSYVPQMVITSSSRKIFYPFVASNGGSVYHKVTLPYNGAVYAVSRWMMNTMELVLSNPYSVKNNEKIFLSYFFTHTSETTWAASNVCATSIGNNVGHCTIQYDISNPAIFYITVPNTYTVVSICNLASNDTAVNYDYTKTTIEACAQSDIPSTCQVVLVSRIDGTDGTAIKTNVPIKVNDTTVSLDGHTHTSSQITGLAAVATSGNYGDLAGKPTVDTSITSTSTNPVTSAAISTALAGKVDKVSGKGLSTNDYTTAEKNKLKGIADNANNYTLPTASGSVLGGIKVGTGLSIDDGTLSVDENRDVKILYHAAQAPASIATTYTGVYYVLADKNISGSTTGAIIAYYNNGTAVNEMTLSAGEVRLCADGTRWKATASGWTQVKSAVNVVQATGTSTEDVMSQKATTDAIANKADKTALPSAATASTAGLAKLYTATGTATDGAMTQKATTDALASKVDTVSGKGLSTNDYTTAEKTKLAGIAEGATKTTVDTALSTTSTNPVQNKVIAEALDNKADKGSNVKLALTGTVDGYYAAASSIPSTVTAGTFACDQGSGTTKRCLTIVANGAIVNDVAAADGAMYMDKNNGHVYIAASGNKNAWVDAGQIKGDKGDKGADGKDGKDGVDGAQTVVQTTGTSTTDVMSQAATTNAIIMPPYVSLDGGSTYIKQLYTFVTGTNGNRIMINLGNENYYTRFAEYNIDVSLRQYSVGRVDYSLQCVYDCINKTVNITGWCSRTIGDNTIKAWLLASDTKNYYYRYISFPWVISGQSQSSIFVTVRALAAKISLSAFSNMEISSTTAADDPTVAEDFSPLKLTTYTMPHLTMATS